MSIGLKQVFRRMQLDSDVRSLKAGEHRKLYNGITVEPQSSTVPLDGVIASLFGNALVANADLAAGTNKVIGGVEDRAYNRYFFSVYNSNSDHTIYQYKDGVITRVLRSSDFDFAATDFVDMDILYDYLVLTNNRTDSMMFNVTKAIAGATYTPAKEEITLIKRPPRGVLSITPVYDIDFLSNYVAGNYFQFFHRYVYEDGKRSVFGGCSASTDSWALPSTTVDVVATSNQALAGTPTVDGILCSAGTRILLIGQTSTIDNGIWVTAAGAWARSTDADSDAEIRALEIYVLSGTINKGNCFNNTNRTAVTIGVDPITFESTLGPNAIDVTIDTTDIPATVTQVEFAVRINGTNLFTIYRIEEVAVSASHRFYNNTFLSTVPDTQTFKWSDSIPKNTKAVKYCNGRIFLFNNTEGYTHSTTGSLVLSTNSVSIVNTRAFRHHKSGATYNCALVFFDLAGRFVGGVHCEASITIPYDNAVALGTARYSISVDLSSIPMADIPLDAVDYAVVVTNVIDKTTFISDRTADIFYFIEASDGTKTYTKTFSGKVTGTAIDIRTLTSNGLGYTFNSGDRIMLVLFTGLGFVKVDVDILSQEGHFVITRPLDEFTSALSAVSSNVVRFEIYTPKEGTVEPFYEVGEKHSITNAGTGSRSFSVTTINPVGDVSTVLRNTYASSGVYSATDPFSNTYTKGSKTIHEAMNSWDKNFDVWVKPGAKSTIKSEFDSVEQVKKTSLRFGGAYDQLSTDLQLNVFEALDEQALYPENGPGVGLAVAGNVLVAIHEIETTAVYVGQGFVLTKDGSSFLTKTDSVIGDTNKYLGGHGSIHQASIVSREGVVYYLDARKGCIVRRSQDGLTPISDLNGVKGYIGALCTAHLALGANSRIIAGWDPQYSCYVISFIDTTGPTGYTLYWNEKANSFVCLSDMRPEFFGQLGINQIAFLSGALWAQTVEANYNKFFGAQYNRRLEWEIGQDSLEKIWEAVEVDAESIYATAGANEAIVLLYAVSGGILQNRINYLDFKLRGSAWRSSVFGNLNDANYTTGDESKYKSRHNTRGQSAFLVITYNGTDKNSMKSISLFYRPSMNTSP